MFNKGSVSILTIYIFALLYAIANATDNDDINIITNYKYVPNKGYMVDIDNVNYLYEKKLIEQNYNQKTDEEKEKMDLFVMSNVPTPKLWLNEWKKNKEQELVKRYKDVMLAPDPKNNNTVYQLLVMSRNAYVPPNADDWVDLTEFGWEILIPFGWSSDSNDKTANNVRGYIFKKRIDENKNVLVVSVKGTSAGLFGIGGPTADNDKYNDNMMFSCCCAIVDRTWKSICGCHSGITNTCELSCLKNESRNYKNSYYEQLKPIFKYVKEERENGSEVFFTGHSLGGALASLSGLTFMSPVATFEAPGEAQFADRIGIKPKVEEYVNLPIYHFGNNGDPIYLGKCTGITSACYYSGFAMETKCHVGKVYLFELDKNSNNPDENNPDDDNSDNDSSSKQNVSSSSSNNMPSKSSSYKKKQSPIFLINKSSIDEHQFYMKRSEMEMKAQKGDVDSSLAVPSNPSKLNMLHHRIDYVINLIKKWEGPWPQESIQDSCVDCENWSFIEGEGDVGRTDPPFP